MDCLTPARLLMSVRQFQDRDMRTSLVVHWRSEESGQDIIEYALLCAFLGFGAVAGVNLLSMAMKNSYVTWDSAAQSDALVEVPDPAGP